MTPVLLTVSHGTRLRAGNLVGAALTARAARLLGVPGRATYVELCTPAVDTTLAALGRPAVVVPLLLSTGVHQRRDIPAMVEAAGVPATVTPGLGPDPLLAEVVARRLLGAGARLTDPVVLTAAGSSDPAGLRDLEHAGRLLAARWGGPVRVATLGGRGPSLPNAVADVRRQSHPRARVWVAPYLLARGIFSRRLDQAANELEVAVAEVIGPDPLLARLVARRYQRAVALAA